MGCAVAGLPGTDLSLMAKIWHNLGWHPHCWVAADMVIPTQYEIQDWLEAVGLQEAHWSSVFTFLIAISMPKQNSCC